MTSTAISSKRRLLRIGHSPDPDDAFMWYPLASAPGNGGHQTPMLTDGPKIDTGSFAFQHVLEDIQSLNDRAERAELEITAISIHQYTYVANDYALTTCGASMGDGYGPMVVASRDLTLDDLRSGMRIAIPGKRTSAHLALQLLLGKDTYAHEVIMFDQIIPAVASGQFDAGLIIHEGQLTYGNSGLKCIVDLGQWWKGRHGLPLPLGGNCIRRDLGDSTMRQICTVLLRSIQYALDPNHRDEAVAYALNFARDMSSNLADQFVGMYVNDWTINYGDDGRRAVDLLLHEAAEAGITPSCGTIDMVEPG